MMNSERRSDERTLAQASGYVARQLDGTHDFAGQLGGLICRQAGERAAGETDVVRHLTDYPRREIDVLIHLVGGLEAHLGEYVFFPRPAFMARQLPPAFVLLKTPPPVPA
jgi:hypothetical protein